MGLFGGFFGGGGGGGDDGGGGGGSGGSDTGSSGGTGSAAGGGYGGGGGDDGGGGGDSGGSDTGSSGGTGSAAGGGYGGGGGGGDDGGGGGGDDSGGSSGGTGSAAGGGYGGSSGGSSGGGSSGGSGSSDGGGTPTDRSELSPEQERAFSGQDSDLVGDDSPGSSQGGDSSGGNDRVDQQDSPGEQRGAFRGDPGEVGGGIADGDTSDSDSAGGSDGSLPDNRSQAKDQSGLSAEEKRAFSGQDSNLVDDDRVTQNDSPGEQRGAFRGDPGEVGGPVAGGEPADGFVSDEVDEELSDAQIEDLRESSADEFSEDLNRDIDADQVSITSTGQGEVAVSLSENTVEAIREERRQQQRQQLQESAARQFDQQTDRDIEPEDVEISVTESGEIEAQLDTDAVSGQDTFSDDGVSEQNREILLRRQDNDIRGRVDQAAEDYSGAVDDLINDLNLDAESGPSDTAPGLDAARQRGAVQSPLVSGEFRESAVRTLAEAGNIPGYISLGFEVGDVAQRELRTERTLGESVDAAGTAADATTDVATLTLNAAAENPQKAAGIGAGVLIGGAASGRAIASSRRQARRLTNVEDLSDFRRSTRAQTGGNRRSTIDDDGELVIEREVDETTSTEDFRSSESSTSQTQSRSTPTDDLRATDEFESTTSETPTDDLREVTEFDNGQQQSTSTTTKAETTRAQRKADGLIERSERLLDELDDSRLTIDRSRQRTRQRSGQQQTRQRSQQQTQQSRQRQQSRQQQQAQQTEIQSELDELSQLEDVATAADESLLSTQSQASATATTQATTTAVGLQAAQDQTATQAADQRADTTFAVGLQQEAGQQIEVGLQRQIGQQVGLQQQLETTQDLTTDQPQQTTTTSKSQSRIQSLRSRGRSRRRGPDIDLDIDSGDESGMLLNPGGDQERYEFETLSLLGGDN